MGDQKIRGAIGLCARAGKLACGDFAVKRSVQMGTAWLVLIDERAAEGTKKRLQYLCGTCEVPYLELPASVEAAVYAGKSNCLLFAVQDENLAKLVCNACGTETKNRSAEEGVQQ